MNRFFKRYPLAAGMALYGGVYGASSVTQQKILSHHRIDYQAVVRNATAACLGTAPLLHGWYKVVAVVAGVGARTWRTSLKITLAEQTFFGPVVISSFFIGTSILAGKDGSYIKQELIAKLPKSYMASWCFFPLVNFFNHLFIPFHLKLAYQSTIAFLWSNFLCLVKEKPVGSSKLSVKP